MTATKTSATPVAEYNALIAQAKRDLNQTKVAAGHYDYHTKEGTYVGTVVRTGEYSRDDYPWDWHMEFPDLRGSSGKVGGNGGTMFECTEAFLLRWAEHLLTPPKVESAPTGLVTDMTRTAATLRPGESINCVDRYDRIVAEQVFIRGDVVLVVGTYASDGNPATSPLVTAEWFTHDRVTITTPAGMPPYAPKVSP